ncbi:histone-lysine N-methyltransferase, H3 lysine-36 specific-like [Leguminivora glycinivorella]|uniref:histone-lysine N-methyltransferase, H3 lysine-36 specific-like n=1 Tax=Leguminivora glycinivorella TaxID=1035111 RepID=UPI00200C4751|nr:histone-lysine N-methyltransferase, H3 lysine-36 specific-like [Leguminivora glycinivorella]
MAQNVTWRSKEPTEEATERGCHHLQSPVQYPDPDHQFLGPSSAARRAALPELHVGAQTGVRYDDVVWHKLGSCAWWPARVLTPGDAPACLLARRHEPTDYPLRYYGTLNHSWARSSQMVLFLPSHATRTGDSLLAQALMDAADDYIAVYLT